MSTDGRYLPPRKAKELPIRKDSLYNRCLYEIASISTLTNVELDWEEVDRLVLEVSRRYVPGEDDVDKIIRHITTNAIYGFTDDIPF